MAIISRQEGRHGFQALAVKSARMRSPFTILDKNSGEEVRIYVTDMPPILASTVPEGSILLNPNAEEAIGKVMVQVDDSWRTIVGAVVEAYEGRKDILAMSDVEIIEAWNTDSGTTLAGALASLKAAFETAMTDVTATVTWAESMETLTTSGTEAADYDVDITLVGDTDSSEVTIEGFTVQITFSPE